MIEFANQASSYVVENQLGGGRGLVPYLVLRRWMQMPFEMCLGWPVRGSVVVRLVGATKRESLPDEVLASMRAILQSVAEEKFLKPDTR